MSKVNLQINWLVRFKNPVFVAQLVASIVIPLIVGVGLSWEDMTSWDTLLCTLAKAMGNPVVVVSMLVSLWNNISDPTTCGWGDSNLAMTYGSPSCDTECK